MRALSRNVKTTFLRCSFALLIAVLIVSAIQVHSAGPFSWDVTITEWIQRFDAGPIASYNKRMGVIGAAGILGIMIILWLWLKGWRAEAVSIGLVGIADLVNPLIREVVSRPRPTGELVTIYREPTDFSFPSGTAMHVLMFCGALIYFSGRVMRPGCLRTTLRILLGLWIPIMGIWVIYRGVHWPSDVLGGYVYGVFFLWAIIWVYQKYTRWRRAYPKDLIPGNALPPLMRPLTTIFRIVY